MKAKKLSRDQLHNLLALTSSYIHDSANLFSLANSSLKDISKKLSEEGKAVLSSEELNDLNHLINFLKGSEYHFREIFTEIQDSQNATQGEFHNYSKSIIDLKDLIELELMEIFTLKRVKTEDNIYQNNALIYGNFSLIAKAVFNLIENALKHSNGEVKITLDDSKDYWKLKILSLENSFNLDLEESFKNLKPRTSGHGLKSVAEILKYNDIELDISSLVNQGTVISLFFPKYHGQKKEINNIMPNPVNEKQLIIKKSTTPFLTKIRSSINLQNLLILLSLITLLFLTNIFKTELEIQQQINQLARFKLSQKQEILLKNFKHIIENDSNYLANYKSLNKSRETLVRKIILKEKFLKFNNTKLEASQIKALEKFSHNLDDLYELDYFLADQYEIQGDFKNQCLYELKAFYKQLLNSAMPNLERRVLETGDLELSLRLLIIKH
ncbi:MAG: sensor histidine kinase [Vampirovibrionia bacterium]